MKKLRADIEGNIFSEENQQGVCLRDIDEYIVVDFENHIDTLKTKFDESIKFWTEKEKKCAQQAKEQCDFIKKNNDAFQEELKQTIFKPFVDK